MKRSQIMTATVGAVAALTAPTYALTVGEARVLSFTDQPLRVLIPIKAQNWEWRAMWASAQTYQKGLGLTATLYKPTGEKTEGVIEIRSKAPITEPIVDLQITFETGHRTTVHRTPILIDVQHQNVAVTEQQAAVPKNPLESYEQDANAALAMPSLVSPVAAPVAPKAPQVSNTPAPASATGFATYPQNGPFPEVKSVVTPPNSHVKASNYETPPAFPPASVKASQGNDIPKPPALVRDGKETRSNQGVGEEQYHVKTGDALYVIANKHKPALWSTEEAMAHIFKHNRKAFSGSTYRTLKAHAVLNFAWDGAEQKSPRAGVPASTTQVPQPQRTSQAAPVQQPVQVAKPFTEEDARAAVMRHRAARMQQELKDLRSAPAK